MEAILENHHLLAQYRNIYKSHLSLKAVIDVVFWKKTCLTRLPICWIRFRIIFQITQIQ